MFRLAWEGQSYMEIARVFGYDPGYIKDTGSRLWQMLSDMLGQKVTKHNFQTALKRSPHPGENAAAPELGTISQPAVTQEQVIVSPLPKTDWGEALNVSVFYSRTEELGRLEQWIVGDADWAQSQRSSLVAILGLGGVGKTALSVFF